MDRHVWQFLIQHGLKNRVEISKIITLSMVSKCMRYDVYIMTLPFFKKVYSVKNASTIGRTFKNSSIFLDLTNRKNTYDTNYVTQYTDLSRVFELSIKDNMTNGALKTLTHLAVLNIENDKIINSSSLGTLTNLTTLVLKGFETMNISDNSFRKLINLTRLTITSNRPFRRCGWCKESLRECELCTMVSVCKITGKFLENLSNLESLCISNMCVIREKYLQDNLPLLKSLDVSCTGRSYGDAILFSHPNLTNLNIAKTSKFTIKGLMSLKHLKHLEYVNSHIINFDAGKFNKYLKNVVKKNATYG